MKIKDLFMLSKVEAPKARPVVPPEADTTGVDRPREKLEKYGPEKLSDSELLASVKN